MYIGDNIVLGSMWNPNESKNGQVNQNVLTSNDQTLFVILF